MIDIKTILLFLIGFLNLLLGTFIYLHNRKSETNIAYWLFALGISGWSFGLAFFRLASTIPQARAWNMVFIIAAGFIASSFLHFCLVFPDEKKKLSLQTKVLLYTPNILIIIMTLTPGVMIKKIIYHSWGKESIAGMGYWFYALYFIVFMGMGYFNLFKKYKKLEKKVKKAQIKVIFLGTLVPVILGAFFNLYLVLIGNYRYVWLGPYFSFVMVVAIAYTILKHHLFNIRVIATELFTSLLVILFFVNIFFYQTLGQLIFNVVAFIGALIIGTLLIRSVLQQVKYREQVEKAYQKLKKLDEAKTEFISIASHQLRTPLTAIKGYISMILEGNYGEISEDVEKPMRNVFESNERLINLVNDLLNVSRIESGKLDLDLQRASIEELISEVVQELKLKAEDKGIEIKWEPSEDLPEIEMDYDKIRQVILNIIDNAISYTKGGNITIETRQKEDKIKVRISDTGEGMSEEEIEHLFDRFSRGKAGNQLNTQGVGLGLYVGKKFVKMHGGEIWAESEGHGEGSEFHIILPIKHEQNTNS